MVNLSIGDFVDGSGLIECPDCGEVVEAENDKCPYCHHGKYVNGDL